MTSELSSKGIPGVAAWQDGPGGLPVLTIATATAQARIFLHGAQLTHWQPAGEEAVIFMSERSAFEVGKAIRGGVPVCLPWFGPRAGSAAHGFARNRDWACDEVRALDGGAVRVSFRLASDEATRALWPHGFAARLSYTIGATLTMELEMENTSAEAFEFSEALHTYFVVGDARQASVRGLDGAEYRDFPDRSQLTRQSGAIRFTEETDRVFVNTDATCVLDDPAMARRIVVEKSGSLSTVVWNPWIAKAAAMADFGDDEWPRMVCIETANAAENSVTLAPGARHRMETRVSVQAR